ncbi:hypothetical protein K431DRAFT_297561 [Polychaeton citri CBS 116435]|uniref:Uncharacterized protein n=1 Tax=Polychaeton citri CBS 116435 TaxID=1314669 RepID=A0A9P4UM74_9PEZI|nr:hypothetical protein K431DRAFT_297561 [Polychaeton citri CBS 116435]
MSRQFSCHLPVICQDVPHNIAAVLFNNMLRGRSDVQSMFPGPLPSANARILNFSQKRLQKKPYATLTSTNKTAGLQVEEECQGCGSLVSILLDLYEAKVATTPLPLFKIDDQQYTELTEVLREDQALRGFWEDKLRSCWDGATLALKMPPSPEHDTVGHIFIDLIKARLPQEMKITIIAPLTMKYLKRESNNVCVFSADAGLVNEGDFGSSTPFAVEFVRMFSYSNTIRKIEKVVASTGINTVVIVRMSKDCITEFTILRSHPQHTGLKSYPSSDFSHDLTPYKNDFLPLSKMDKSIGGPVVSLTKANIDVMNSRISKIVNFPKDMGSPNVPCYSLLDDGATENKSSLVTTTL